LALPQATQLRRLIFTDNGTAWIAGYATGGRGLWLKSSDDGQTWSEATLPPQMTAITALAYTDKVMYVAATSDKPALVRLFSSADGGETWNLIYEFSSGQPTQFSSIGVFGSAIFVIGIDGRKVFGVVSHNGGRDFQVMEGLGHLTRAWTLDVVDQKRAYLGGYFSQTGRAENASAVLLRTLDGGLDWQALEAPKEIVMFLSLLFLSPDRGFAIGGDGTIYTLGIGSDSTLRVESIPLTPKPTLGLEKLFSSPGGAIYAVGTSGLYRGKP